MSNVNADGIVTPDESNILDPEIWSAAMADSISLGLGARMAKQELLAGIKASLPALWSFSGNFNIVPLTIGPGTDYLTGVGFAGGVAIMKYAKLSLVLQYAT